MVIGATGQESRLPVSLGDPQPENVAIEPHRALEIGDGQVDVPDVGKRIDIGWRSRPVADVGQRGNRLTGCPRSGSFKGERVRSRHRSMHPITARAASFRLPRNFTCASKLMVLYLR